MSRILYTTEFVREEMAKENCILLDEYVKGQLRIRYEYNGVVYTVRWYDWYRKDRPSRPHLTGGNRTTKPHQRWNNEKVNELLQKDNCELTDEYRNTKQRFKYTYQGSYFWVTLDDWIYHKARPHLYINEHEQRFRRFLEENVIDFETQKSYEDLKSKNNYKLRFDFYIPELELLVEIDDRSHVNNSEQIENGKIKDDYCLEHKLKLLRLDETVKTEDEYFDAINSIDTPDIYVLRYGRIYRTYNGKNKEKIKLH